jgi:hypothetical protein
LDDLRSLTTGKNFDVDGLLTIDASPLVLDGGSLEADGITVTGGGSLVWVRGSVNLTGGNSTLDLVIPSLGQLAGNGTVTGTATGLAGSAIVADNGDMTLGDPTSYAGFSTEGTVDTQENTITLRAAGFAGLGVQTTLGSGSLVAANGVALGVGDNLVGTGTVDGDLVNDGGTIRPGSSSGTTTLTGNLTINAGTLEMEIGGYTAGSEYDQVHVTGTADLGGALDVSLIDDFAPMAGDRFDVVTAASFVGNPAFDEVTPIRILPTDDLIWATDVTATTLSLVASVAGDFQRDGDVDAFDLMRWQNGYGTGGTTFEEGDAQFDGDVDGFDLLIWQNNYGFGSGASPVPEPSTLLLLPTGLLAFALFAQRRR